MTSATRLSAKLGVAWPRVTSTAKQKTNNKYRCVFIWAVPSRCRWVVTATA